MVLARAVRVAVAGWAGGKGGVGGDLLACARAGKQPEHGAGVLDCRHQLLDRGDDDIRLWQIPVRSPFPSLVTIAEDPVSAMSRLAPVIPTSAKTNLSRSAARASASRSGTALEERSCGSPRMGADEILGDLFFVEMDHRSDDVARSIVSDLDDVLAEIGLSHLDERLVGTRICEPFSSFTDVEGRGSQLSTFVPSLLRQGFRVVTFDAPGHGDSPLPQRVGDRAMPARSRRWRRPSDQSTASSVTRSAALRRCSRRGSASKRNASLSSHRRPRRRRLHPSLRVCSISRLVRRGRDDRPDRGSLLGPVRRDRRADRRGTSHRSASRRPPIARTPSFRSSAAS